MSSARTILNLGHPEAVSPAADALFDLHRRQPISHLLFAQGGSLGAFMAQGGFTLELPSVGWSGHYAIQRGERPPCIGIDLVRAVLADAVAMPTSPEIIVWGPVFAFYENRRVREWDAAQSAIVDEVLRCGLGGWGWAAGRLVRLMGVG